MRSPIVRSRVNTVVHEDVIIMPEDRPDKLKPSGVGWNPCLAETKRAVSAAQAAKSEKVVTGGDRQPTALAVVRLTTIVEGTADQFCE